MFKFGECCFEVNVLAAWMLLFNMVLYVFKFVFRVLYFCVPGLVFFNFEYNLSLYLIDLSNHCVIHFDFLRLYFKKLTNLQGICFSLAIKIASCIMS